MKTFYSCIDIGCSDLVTQPIQHLVNADMATQRGGKVTFYTSEDPITLGSQSVLRAKLDNMEHVDGIIFFRLAQFSYGGSFNYGLLQDILRRGYEVHFAREALSMTGLDDLQSEFNALFIAAYLASDQPAAVLADLARGRN